MISNSIPVISFEPFLKGDREQRAQVAQDVYQAFHDVGFLYLKDFGITQAEVDEIFNLSAEFFALPLEFKQRYALSDPAVNQGYTADGAEGVGDHKECYEHRRFRNELCPTKSDLADFNILKLQSFRETLDEFYMKCFTLSQRVLKCLAIAMKLPGGEDFFTNITKHADPQMRLLHYPPVPASLITLPGESLGEGKEGRIMPHTDFGFCTLLFQDNVGGLEVDPFYTGNFIQAKPIPGTVLINIGDLLHRLLNGRVKSTIHRVVSPPDRTIGESGEAMLPPRYSIPYFVHPDPDTMIDPIILAEGERKLFAAVNAGKWRDWNTAKNYGMKGQEELLKNSMTAVVG